MYRITVGDPQKIGDPISAHIVYTVHTKVRPLLFPDLNRLFPTPLLPL